MNATDPSLLRKHKIVCRVYMFSHWQDSNIKYGFVVKAFGMRKEFRSIFCPNLISNFWNCWDLPAKVSANILDRILFNCTIVCCFAVDSGYSYSLQSENVLCCAIQLDFFLFTYFSEFAKFRKRKIHYIF